MRGTLWGDNEFAQTVGIIPAYAGNTRVFPEFGIVRVGSSPRMRGTLLTSWGLSEDNGIIPAYAGNTSNTVCRTQ